MNEAAASDRRELRATTFAYYALYVSLGLFVVLGPSLDVFKDRSGSTDGQIALLFLVQAIGYTAGGAFSGRFFDRYPGHPIMAVSLAGASLAIASLTLLSSLPALAVMCFVYGLVAGPMDTGGNSLLIRLHGDDVGPWMVGLHASFGVGAGLAPLVLAVSRATTNGIDAGLWFVGLVGLVGAFRLLRRPSPPLVAPAAVAGTPAKRIANRQVLVLMFLFFAFAVAVEVGFGGWVFTYATDKGLSEGRASLLNSVFWWAFTAARIAGIPIAGRVSNRLQLILDAAVCAFGAAVLVVFSGAGPGLWIGAVLFGIGVATMFPAMINFANERVAVTGKVTSVFIAAAGFGGAVGPWLLGRLFDANGTDLLPVATFVGSVLLGVVAFFSVRVLDR